MFNSEMYFIMYTKNTYIVSIYCYWRLNNKFVKWNENFYIYNAFPKFYIKIIFDCKSV